MYFGFGIAFLTFIIGLFISIIVGGFFDDGGVASATAICYAIAIYVGMDSGKNKERRIENDK